MRDRRKPLQNHYIQGGLVLALALAVAFVMNARQGYGGQGTTPATALDVDPTPGSLAPEFSLTTVDGEVVSLSELRGKIALVNFWATWCGPCQIEMPAIQARFEQYKDDGFVVLAVNFDESQEAVEGFRNEFDLRFELLLDPGAEVQKLYRNRSYPTSFFIDAQGVVQILHIGVMTEGQLDSYLEQLGLST